MAVDKCKDHFAALFPFHEVLKAPGTVLIAHAVEHKQQTFGRVWEPNLLLQGPLILWCQLSVTCSDPYFSLMISVVWAIALGDPQRCFRGKLPLRLKEIPMQVSQLIQSESALCTDRVLERPAWVTAVSDTRLSSPVTPVLQNWCPTEEGQPWERILWNNFTEL